MWQTRQCPKFLCDNVPSESPLMYLAESEKWGWHIGHCTLEEQECNSLNLDTLHKSLDNKRGINVPLNFC